MDASPVFFALAIIFGAISIGMLWLNFTIRKGTK